MWRPLGAERSTTNGRGLLVPRIFRAVRAVFGRRMRAGLLPCLTRYANKGACGASGSWKPTQHFRPGKWSKRWRKIRTSAFAALRVDGGMVANELLMSSSKGRYFEP